MMKAKISLQTTQKDEVSLAIVGGTSFLVSEIYDADLFFFSHRVGSESYLDQHSWSSHPRGLTSKRLTLYKTDEQQDAYKAAVNKLLVTAGKKNWDGEGADPVTEDAVAVALEVVEEFPDSLAPPEISADPEGNVEFDWHLDNGTMFAISVGQTGDVAISGLCNGKAKLTGMEWDSEGQAHSLLRCGLGWLVKMQGR